MGELMNATVKALLLDERRCASRHVVVAERSVESRQVAVAVAVADLDEARSRLHDIEACLRACGVDLAEADAEAARKRSADPARVQAPSASMGDQFNRRAPLGAH